MFARQREIVPLSGNPYFTRTLSRYDVHDYRLSIPKQFSHHMPKDSARALLFCGDKMWEVHYVYHKDNKYFRRSGWRAFVVDNDMHMGDGCVFELMDKEKMHFKVQILRGDAPDLPCLGGDGRNSSDPILID
ncbi:B3 domain-containing protein Os04g0386900-like [Zingiber officinale]|uniref:B3 domain-containing protein Os04g0386900-like n=1 Tax=Zingiber officinale TaxID=94328 RepID=UPI001C4D42CD|nr:B3 domain-containing protein Os04g0386900-like [Zingiber officinale]